MVRRKGLVGRPLDGSSGVAPGKPSALAAGGCCIMNEKGNTAGA